MLKTMLIIIIVLASLEVLACTINIFQSNETMLEKWHGRTARDADIQRGVSFFLSLIWIAIVVLSSILLSN